MVAEDGLISVPSRYWYSRPAFLAFLIGLFLVVEALAALIPPFQSPDEFHHVERAHLLAHGEIVLDWRGGAPGGDIDDGLRRYMVELRHPRWFAYEYRRRPVPDIRRISLGEDIRWSGQRHFDGLVNVAPYFPALYLPQAIALGIGEKAGWTVSDSYHLARLFSLVATLALLYLAARLYPMPPLVVAIFIIPMSLFQMGSASLDAVAYAMTALAAALFMRGATPDNPFGWGMHVALAACLFVLVNSRSMLLPLTFLPAVLFLVRRSRIGLISSVVLLLTSMLWTFLSSWNPDPGATRTSITEGTAFTFYLTHPGAFLSALYTTLTDPHLLATYWNQFIGAFGWSGVIVSDSGEYIARQGLFLSPVAYSLFGALFLALVVLSLWRLNVRSLHMPTLALLGGAVLSTLLLFLLITVWMPPSMPIIWQVQGRYFIPIAIVLGYAVSGRSWSPRQVTAGLIILLCIAVLSVSSTARTLLLGYWI